MNLFVDTSVWSLAFRRDSPEDFPEVAFLRRAIEKESSVFATGLILQELLQGFRGPRARERILEHFSTLPFIDPQRSDHIAAAELRNRCRKRGIQTGTIDALIAQLCIEHSLVLLTTDQDFQLIAKHFDLSLALN